ncbi:putative trypsin-6 [Frankliniella occidentalis]|uniref:Trypsin-6 n=1 Tax=Frankliniella occidentalis TaxID=133901 RepID=A0A6J1TEL2_FRAOC|nr:putative trypsin-6 [Frankliniella occidentalis]
MGSASALGAHIILGFGLLEALSPAIVSATTDIDPQTAVKSNLLFLVEIQKTDNSGAEIRSCTGALISPLDVITAGDCVDVANASNVNVLTGALLGQGSRVVHAAQTVMRHPKYVIVNGAANVNFNFDVSLVRLKEALVLGTQASTIALTSPGARAAVGANITVAGFGIYDWGEDDNGKPRLKQGQIMNSVVCGNQMLANITPEEFCVSNPPDNGNSGCPAFIGNVLYGIMSWGSTVFVDVAEPEINTFISMNIKV